tara:strand:+ start:196 stop:1041 length:846 start_codon:yes stop_codon:yes gene_type:complete
MDYLNYGQQDKQQPQKPQPQGFGQQKVQLTTDDFSFGNLKEQERPQPTNVANQVVSNFPPNNSSTISSPPQDELIQLFPTPILISPYQHDYSKELEWIRNIECTNEGYSQGGGIANTYNRQSKDSFILDHPEMSRIREFIQIKINQFTNNILGSECDMVITQSWLNKNAKGESHHEHKHPNSIVSGVWYPVIHEKLPPIQFRNNEQRDVTLPTKSYNHFNSATFLLPMKKGELILFPSNLQHSVQANVSDEERISLSFNTWAKGNLGDKQSLTYLPFDRLM